MKISLATLGIITEDVSEAVEILSRFAYVKEFRAVLDLGEEEDNVHITVTTNEGGNIEIEVPGDQG